MAINPMAVSNQQLTETTLNVAGMDCADEVAAVKGVLEPLADVDHVEVNLIRGTVTVSHHDSTLSADALITAIGKAGLKATSSGSLHEEASGIAGVGPFRLISVAISGVVLGAGLLWGWLPAVISGGEPGSATIQLWLYMVSIIAGGSVILPKAMGAVRRISLDMNVLMSLAVLGAVGIGEWAEGAAVVFLFALSELLESFSLGRVRRAIRSLLNLSPSTALVRRGDSIEPIPVESARVDDRIVIRSGARIPLDGKVLSGRSTVNQAPITGESLPVEKNPGDGVFAGTINGDGALEVAVTKLSKDTTLARIIHLIEEAQTQKAPTQRFVDSFARYYTPGVMVLAILIGVVPPLLFSGGWSEWCYRALVLLVIACPCALVISTPVSFVSGLTAMARRGVLVKGGTVLEAVGQLKALATDKTGTLTEGVPRVIQVAPLGSQTENTLLRIAAAIDVHSNHPLAGALVDYARERGIEFPECQNYLSRNGLGAEGEIDGHSYFVGNHRFAQKLALCSEALEAELTRVESRAKSVIIVGHKPHAHCQGEILGVIVVGDAIRANAREAIRAIHAAGINPVIMLSGDNQVTVDAIAAEVGIDQAYGDLLPEQKVERVRGLAARYKNVGMIGDGINDAPAMAAASVGIAMGVAGSDTAIETADMALMKDDLSKIAEAVRLGRRVLRIIQANIAFALGLKLIFLLLAITGYTSLWLAILADTGATLIVIANSLRLLKR